MTLATRCYKSAAVYSRMLPEAALLWRPRYFSPLVNSATDKESCFAHSSYPRSLDRSHTPPTQNFVWLLLQTSFITKNKKIHLCILLNQSFMSFTSVAQINAFTSFTDVDVTGASETVRECCITSATSSSSSHPWSSWLSLVTFCCSVPSSCCCAWAATPSSAFCRINAFPRDSITPILCQRSWLTLIKRACCIWSYSGKRSSWTTQRECQICVTCWFQLSPPPVLHFCLPARGP